MVAGVASLFSPPASASDITWTNTSGNFQWNTTTTNNWSSNIPWNNTKSDSAIFNSAGAGTINVTTPIVLRGMAINANGYVINGSTLSLTSGGSGTVGIGEIRVGSGFSATIGSVLTGSVGLQKTGVGTLILTGINTYTGGTNVSGGGVLSVSADNQLGNAAGALTLTGSSLQITGTSYTGSARIVTLNTGGGIIDVNNPANTHTMTGKISGVGGLRKQGTGTLVLANTNNIYAGGTVFEAGTLSVSADSQLGAFPGSAWTFEGGTLQITGTSFTSTSRAINWTSAGGTWDIANANNNFTVNQSLSGTGSLTKLGAGTLTLAGTNTLDGEMLVNTGNLHVTGATSVTSTPIVVNSGTLGVTNGGTLTSPGAYVGGAAGTINVGGGSGTSTWNNTTALALGQGGTGILNITGGGTVSNPTAYLGIGNGGIGTANVGGGSGTAIWNSNGLYVGSSGTGILNITGGGTVNSQFGVVGFQTGSTGTVTVGGGTGTSTWNISDTLTVGDQSTGTLNINSGGTVSTAALAGGFGSSAINLNGGTLRITGTDTASNAFNVLAGHGTIDTPTSGNTFTITGNMSGTGELTKNGTGTLTLAGTNTFSGGMLANAGTVNLTGNNNYGTGTVLARTGAILNIPGGGSLSNGSSHIADAAIVNVGGGTGTAQWTNSGDLLVGLHYSGTLNVTGGGTVSSANGFVVGLGNSYTGTANIGGGTGLSYWNNSGSLSVGASGNAILNITGGGTVSNTSSYIGNVSISLATVNVGGGTGTAAWNSSGALEVGRNGPGILNISSGGIVSAAALGGGYSGSSVQFNGGTLSITGTSSASNVINLQSGGGTIDTPNLANTFTITSALTGSGMLTKTGPGTLTLAGNNTFSGGLTANAGTVLLTGANTLNTGGLSVSAAMLNIPGGASLSNSSYSYLGEQPGSMAVVNVGGGTGTASWNSSWIVVGLHRPATLNILGGGMVTSAGALLGGTGSADGIVNVGGGTGLSSWIMSGPLTLGMNATGTLNITGGGTVSNTDGIIGDTPSAGGTVNVGGGTGTANWINSGNLTVGNGSKRGTLNLNSGGIVSAAALEGGNSISSLNFNGGTLRITGSDSANNTMNLLTGGGTFDIPSSVNFSITSSISGVGSLAKTGFGTLTLSGANTFTGGINIQQGTLSVTSDDALGPVSQSIAIQPFGSLNYATNATTGRIFNLSNGSLRTSGGATLTLNNALVGGGYLAGNFATTGNTIIAGSTSQPSASISLGGSTALVNFNNGSQLTAGSGSTTSLMGFNNQPAGRVSVGAGVVNVQDFQSSGVINIFGTGQVNNTGSTPIVMGGGSVTNVGVYYPINGQVTHGGTIDIGNQDIVVLGGLLRNNGTITGAGKLVVEYGGLAKGAGDYDVGGVELRNGGQLLFGNSPGLTRISNVSFVGATVTGGDLTNATGTVGGFAHAINGNANNSGWSALEYGNSANTGGGLTLQQGAAGPVLWRFRTTLNDAIGDTAGLAANFDPNLSYSWLIARPRTNASAADPLADSPGDQINTVALITLLDQSNNSLPLTNANLNLVMEFDTSLFANSLSGTFSFSFGSDLVNRDNTVIFLNYVPTAVPEPSAWMLILGTAGACGYVSWARRKRTMTQARWDGDSRKGE